MDDLTVTELDLIACFGVEPRFGDPAEPWYFNRATYEVEVDGLEVSFTLCPMEQELSLLIRRGSQRVVEINPCRFVDLRTIDEPGRDAVEVQLSGRAWFVLQLRPAVGLLQGFGDGC